MSVSKETLRTMIRDLNLIPLSEEEIDILLPDVQANAAVLEKIRSLDLNKVPTARQIQPQRKGSIR
ncbi:MAG: hypothetical protein V2A61_02565 [Calditrichota bacterium]